MFCATTARHVARRTLWRDWAPAVAIPSPRLSSLWERCCHLVHSGAGDLGRAPSDQHFVAFTRWPPPWWRTVQTQRRRPGGLASPPFLDRIGPSAPRIEPGRRLGRIVSPRRLHRRGRTSSPASSLFAFALWAACPLWPPPLSAWLRWAAVFLAFPASFPGLGLASRPPAPAAAARRCQRKASLRGGTRD